MLQQRQVVSGRRLIEPYEKELSRADGTTLPVLIGAVMPDDELDEGVGFILDNSQRKHALQQLEERNSELEQASAEVRFGAQRLRAVLDAARDAVISVDRHARIVEWNRGSSELFGWTHAEALGRNAIELIVPELYRPVLAAELVQFLETGEGAAVGKVLELDAQDRAGRVFPVEVSVGHPVGSGSNLLFTAFISDISARRAAQETIAQRNIELEMLNAELLRSETRMRALFESPLIGAYFWQIDGSIREANEHMLKLTGYSPLDLQDGRLSWTSLAGPEHPERPGIAARIVRERGGFGPAETTIVRADGTPLQVLTGAYMLDSEREEGVAFMLDISAQHEARETIRQRNAELQQANAELDNSRARLQRMFDAPLVGTCYWEGDGMITGANDLFLRLLGYTRAELEQGLDWTWIVPAEVSADPFHKDRVERMFRGESTAPVEVELFRRDGSRIPVLLVSMLISPESDSREGATFIFDITEQRAARLAIEERNAALQRSEERIRAIFDSPLSAMAFWTLDGKITEANPTFLELTGYTADEVGAGQIDWQALTPPELREKQKGVTNRLHTQRVIPPEEDILYRKDGERVHVMAGGALLPGSDSDCVAFLLDISEQHRAQALVLERKAELEQLAQELERSQAHLKRMFDSPMLGVLHWNQSGQILNANDRLLQMLGFSREDFEQGRMGWENVSPPEFAELDAERLGQLATAGEIEPYEKEFIRADGKRLPVLVGAATLDFEKGEGVAYAADASELRRQREEIEARNSELQRINAELDSFSYSVSHDLRAPLRAVEGFSKALEEDFGTLLDDSGRRYLARIRAGTVRMGQLIDDLLQLSRVGRAELAVVVLDLSELAQLVARQLTESAPQRRVEWQIQPGLLVEGDPRLLRIVLENLLGNAFKFTAQRETAQISFGRRMTPQGMAYAVSDNGAGFDMTYAGKLFTAFQRLHTQEQFSGTGIGLSIVRRILTRHSGDIWAESAPDKGATFYFTLRFGAKHGQ